MNVSHSIPTPNVPVDLAYGRARRSRISDNRTQAAVEHVPGLLWLFGNTPNNSVGSNNQQLITDRQSIENQFMGLHTGYRLCGAKGCAARPALDRIMRDGAVGRADVVMSWGFDLRYTTS